MWVHEALCIPHFAWQEGYAAITVSATARELGSWTVRRASTKNRLGHSWIVPYKR